MTGERGPEGAATACVQYVLWADGLMRGRCAEREEPGGRTEPTPSERGHRGNRKRENAGKHSVASVDTCMAVTLKINSKNRKVVKRKSWQISPNIHVKYGEMFSRR